MDVLRLDRSSYLPDKLIEGYESMIWTERFLPSGDFQMKTTLVDETVKLLPEMSLISLRDTKEVMYVTTHDYSYNSDGYFEVTIKGKSVDTFVQHRTLEGPYKKKYKMARNYTRAEASAILLWNSLVNPTENDVTRAGPWTRSTLDTIPNFAISDSSTVGSGSKRKWLTGGQVYPQLIDFLGKNHLGIRTIRPDSGPAKIVSVSTNDKGIISYNTVTNTTKMRLDLYNGVDRSRNQQTRNRIIFHQMSDHVVDPKYLRSIETHATMAFVVSSVGIIYVYRNRPRDKVLGGWDRRVVWVDGGEPETEDTDVDDDLTKAQIRNRNAAIRAEFKEDLPEAGEIALENNDRTNLFEGQISENVAYKYNRDYFLGDQVTLMGEYGPPETMFVAEYTRTEDKEGDRGFPGLVVVGE